MNLGFTFEPAASRRQAVTKQAFENGDVVRLGDEVGIYSGDDWMGKAAPEGRVWVVVNGDVIAAKPDEVTPHTASRKTASKTKETSMRTEAELLQAMAKATSLEEQRRLMADLEELRRGQRQAVQADRDLDLADTFIRDTLTPVRVHERHTAATDWINEVSTADLSYDHPQRVEATRWYQKLIPEVKADREELKAQAEGMARRTAGQYGEQAQAAYQAFMDTVAHLYSKAAEGDSESGPCAICGEVKDAPAHQETDFGGIDHEFVKEGRRRIASEDEGGQTCAECGDSIARDPEGEDPRTWHHDNGESHDHEAKPKSDSKESRRKTAYDFTHEERRWYNEGYDRGQSDRQDFAEDEGIDPDDYALTPDDYRGNPLSGEMAGQSIPEIFGSWEAATPEAQSAYEEGYEDGFQASPRQGSKRRTAGVYCKTHQVWVGDENRDTHSRDSCKKEQRATEKTKDARRKTADRQKAARDVQVGDQVSSVTGFSPTGVMSGVVSSVDTTSTPGTVYINLNGSDWPPADLVLSHGDPVYVTGAEGRRKTADDKPGQVDEDQSGNAESQVTDYDTKADQDPMWSEDWEDDGDTGHHPPIPGASGSDVDTETMDSLSLRRRRIAEANRQLQSRGGGARPKGRTADRKEARPKTAVHTWEQVPVAEVKVGDIYRHIDNSVSPFQVSDENWTEVFGDGPVGTKVVEVWEDRHGLGLSSGPYGRNEVLSPDLMVEVARTSSRKTAADGDTSYCRICGVEMEAQDYAWYALSASSPKRDVESHFHLPARTADWPGEFNAQGELVPGTPGGGGGQYDAPAGTIYDAGGQPISVSSRRKVAAEGTVGERRRLRLPYSEVNMHMQVAGEEMIGELVSPHAVQLYTLDGQQFSFPIGAGEAGWGMHGSDLGPVTGGRKIAENPGRYRVVVTLPGGGTSLSTFDTPEERMAFLDGLPAGYGIGEIWTAPEASKTAAPPWKPMVGDRVSLPTGQTGVITADAGWGNYTVDVDGYGPMEVERGVLTKASRRTRQERRTR